MVREGSFVRWQAIALNQLGYSVGLILTYAAASLGFGLSLIKDDRYQPGCWAKAFMLFALFSLAVSIGLGLWCVVNRLRDFRITRSIARDRENCEREPLSDIEIDRRLHDRRSESKRLGKWTWRIFAWQLGTFAFGSLCLTIAFIIAFHTKIF